MNKTNILTYIRYLTITLIIMVLFVPSHAAEMYKWVDSEGVVHFSDERPAGADKPQSVKVESADAKTDISTEEADSPQKTKSAKAAREGAPDTLHKIRNFPIMKQDPNWCALTSIAMIAQYYGYSIDPVQVSIESGIPLEQGMTLEAILKYFEQLKALKLDVEYHYKGDLEEIKKYIDNNIPILWLHAVPARIGRGRHAAVVIGYDDTERRMITADPAYGTEVSMSYADFLKRWRESSELIIAVTSRI
ncbi:MAG TPA: C39 family peptidase [Syntrophales bacterium]|nr:C39 family peptidase [Syntrophales bacterium]